MDLGPPDSLYEEFGILFKNHTLPLRIGANKQKYFRAVQKYVISALSWVKIPESRNANLTSAPA